MKRKMYALLGVALVTLSLACGNFKGNGKQGGDSNGDSKLTTADCQPPYFLLSAWVDNIGLPKGDFYGARSLSVTITGTDAEGNALEFTDEKTKQQTRYVQTIAAHTSAVKKYSACLEYGEAPVSFYTFNVLIVDPIKGDVLYVQIRKDTDTDALTNRCAPNHSDTREEGVRRMLNVTCIVETVV